VLQFHTYDDARLKMRAYAMNSIFYFNLSLFFLLDFVQVVWNIGGLHPNCTSSNLSSKEVAFLLSAKLDADLLRSSKFV